MGHGNGLLDSIVISAGLLLACCTPATSARVSSGLLAEVPGDLRQDVEIASRATEAASRRLQQEAATARLLPPDQVQFVVSVGSKNKTSWKLSAAIDKAYARGNTSQNFMQRRQVTLQHNCCLELILSSVLSLAAEHPAACACGCCTTWKARSACRVACDRCCTALSVVDSAGWQRCSVR